jgi:DNA-binding response OmpR family regulator
MEASSKTEIGVSESLSVSGPTFRTVDRKDFRSFSRGVPDVLSQQNIPKALGRQAGRAVSRVELLARDWGLNPAGINTRTIDMHIARLREQLQDDPGSPESC